MVAPVAAGGGISSSNGGGGTEVTLTRGEAMAATDGTHRWGQHDLAAGRIKDKSLIGQPIGHGEMARRKLWGQKNGLYDKNFTDA